MVQHSSPDVGDDDIFCENAPASDKIASFDGVMPRLQAKLL
jgi:hypothetical protein